MKQITSEENNRLMDALRINAPGRLEALKGRIPKIRLMKLGKAMSGVYLGWGLIFLNSRMIKDEHEINDIWWLSIIAHELEHARQGVITAFSVYGELLAWKAGFEVIQKGSDGRLSEIAIKILDLPNIMDRETLRKARDLMITYAGKGYGIQWRPYYPIHQEIQYWLGMRR